MSLSTLLLPYGRKFNRGRALRRMSLSFHVLVMVKFQSCGRALRRVGLS